MRRRAGFTLLEVVVALSILGLGLMAVYDLNAGAVAMHAYGKKVTVASMLARSKMTDVEQELYDKGFSTDDEEKSGDFSDEGWSAFKWRATIVAPKTNGVSPEQLLGAIFNLPLGGSSSSSSDPLGALSALFGGGTSAPKPPGSQSNTSAPTPTGTGGLSSPAGALGAGLIQTQFTQLVDQITKSVREVHLTVSWKEGKTVETIDLVTHVVSMGQGGDRNGNLAAAAQQAALQSAGGLVNSRTGQPCVNARQGPNGMIDPQTGDPCVPANQTPGLFGGQPLPGQTPNNPTPTPHRAGGR